MVEPPVSVDEVILDGVRQVQLLDPALLDPILVDPLTDHSTTEVHQRKGLGCKVAKKQKFVALSEHLSGNKKKVF